MTPAWRCTRCKRCRRWSRIVAGGAAAIGLGRFVETQLYSVQPLDVVSFAATGGVMMATALAASLVPAIRALRVDPVTALRKD